MPHHPIDVAVGDRLRRIRQAANLSQSDLANRLNISFQQIQKYEKGANRISVSRLFEISEVLKVAPSSFFEGIEKADIEPPVYVRPRSTKIANLIDRLPDSDRNAIRLITETLAMAHGVDTPSVGERANG
jgi:transcriptional regulator with XRE-family HTH domain